MVTILDVVFIQEAQKLVLVFHRIFVGLISPFKIFQKLQSLNGCRPDTLVIRNPAVFKYFDELLLVLCNLSGAVGTDRVDHINCYFFGLY